MNADRICGRLSLGVALSVAAFALMETRLGGESIGASPYVPFAIPEGFVVLNAAKADQEMGTVDLFAIGGFVLKHSDGALIYSYPNDVIPPKRERAEVRRHLLEFLQDPGVRYKWPFHKVQERRAFEVRGVQWIWLAGESFQKGRMHYFIHAQSEMEMGSSEVLALAPIEQRDSISKVLTEVVESMTGRTD